MGTSEIMIVFEGVYLTKSAATISIPIYKTRQGYNHCTAIATAATTATTTTEIAPYFEL
jgi:hypothetical protein